MAAMFSARTSWDRTANLLTIAVESAKASGRALVDLTESNPTRAGIFDTAPLVAELGHPRGTVYEPASLGHADARRAVVAYYASRGLAVDPERVVLSASTSEAYSWIMGLVSDPGDAILVPRPSYPLLGWIAATEGVRLASYPLHRDAGFRIDLDELRRAIDGRTRAIVLIHPNNPTGSFVREDEARALAELAREHDLALVVDEVFGDYDLEGAPGDAVRSFACNEAAPLVFTMSGLSKVLLLPQCKLGWTVVSGDADKVREALARLELVADTFLSVATPVQLALPELFRHRDSVQRAVSERLRTNLRALDEAIAHLGPTSTIRRLPAPGGWYAILEIPRLHDEDKWVELLVREESLIVHPGHFFDFDRDGFLVVSLLPAPEIFDEGARRLTSRVGGT
jgi:aspartate/methionine/tyrosine aminotransferase